MLTTAGRERQEQLSVMLSDYGRGRLLAYADSFRELSRSYREELANKENRRREGVSRQQVLEERRLWENRQALCHNLDEMSQIMARLAAEVFCLTPLSPREERTVTRALKQEGITVLDLFYIDRPARGDVQDTEDGEDTEGVTTIGLHMFTQRMAGHGSQEVADMLSVLLGRGRWYP